MSTEPQPLATHEFHPDRLQDALAFLKRTRGELRNLRKTRVWKDRLQIFDVNNDYFEIQGVGYPSRLIVDLLDAVDTVYKPDNICDATERDFKEFKNGRRYPWAADRVM